MRGFIHIVQTALQVPDIKSFKTIYNVKSYAERLHDQLLQNGPRIILAFVFLIAGWWFIGVITRTFNRLMIRREIDATLRPFLRSLTSITLKILLLLSVAAQIGIQTTSFMAALGAAGLAVGLALQGSLANFAGGILILVFKPFRVGDYIGTQRYEGSVAEIQILYTILTTPDNKKVVIPNGVLSNNEVVNFSANENRRLDLKISISYTNDILKARDILQNITQANAMVLQDPAPIIGVSEMNSTSIIFNVWVWVSRADMINARHQVLESAKLAFDEAGIKMPYSELELAQGKKTV